LPKKFRPHRYTLHLRSERRLTPNAV
jgi:hypothetical protein